MKRETLGNLILWMHPVLILCVAIPLTFATGLPYLSAAVGCAVVLGAGLKLITPKQSNA
jgi:hypothetical protein